MHKIRIYTYRSTFCKSPTVIYISLIRPLIATFLAMIISCLRQPNIRIVFRLEPRSLQKESYCVFCRCIFFNCPEISNSYTCHCHLSLFCWPRATSQNKCLRLNGSFFPYFIDLTFNFLPPPISTAKSIFNIYLFIQWQNRCSGLLFSIKA